MRGELVSFTPSACGQWGAFRAVSPSSKQWHTQQVHEGHKAGNKTVLVLAGTTGMPGVQHPRACACALLPASKGPRARAFQPPARRQRPHPARACRGVGACGGRSAAGTRGEVRFVLAAHAWASGQMGPGEMGGEALGR